MGLNCLAELLAYVFRAHNLSWRHLRSTLCLFSNSSEVSSRSVLSCMGGNKIVTCRIKRVHQRRAFTTLSNMIIFESNLLLFAYRFLFNLFLFRFFEIFFELGLLLFSTALKFYVFLFEGILSLFLCGLIFLRTHGLFL